MKYLYKHQRYLLHLMRTGTLIIVLLSMFGALLGAASAASSQDVKLTEIQVQMDARQAPVGQVLENLEQQTNLRFGYSHQYLNTDRRVSVAPETGNTLTLQQALEQLFAGTRTTWILSNGVVQLKTWPEKNAQTGVIAGRITDAETGAPMPGATMQIEGTNRGTPADGDGKYRLENVAPGTYTLVFSFVGYQQTTAEGIQVEEDQVTTVDATLVPKTSQMDEVVVEAEVDVDTAPVIEATDVDVVNTISESNMVISGISAEQISKTPDSDAAEVVRRTPGVTLTGNYVNLRGLSDRHTATFIDGMDAPSTAKYSSSFNYDLLPAGVIDRVLTYKSPAAELPGDWGGGVVKIFTKNTSVARELQVSLKSSYSARSSFQDYFTQQNSDTDWLGYDGGLRQIPDKFFTYDRNDPIGNSAAAQTLPKTWNMHQAKSNTDWSGKLRYYDSWKPFGLRVNNLTALKYSNSFDLEPAKFRDLIIGRDIYDSEGNLIPEEERQKGEGAAVSSDTSYTEKVRISALQNLGFWVNDHHQIQVKNFFNQLGNTRTTTKDGAQSLYPGEWSHETERLVEHYYQQRTLYNGQFAGMHELGNNYQHQIDWKAGYSYAREKTPDQRVMLFTSNEVPREQMEAGNYVPANYNYQMAFLSTYKIGARHYSDSREDSYTAELNYQWQTPFNSTLKAGIRGLSKERRFETRTIGLGTPSFDVEIYTKNPWFIVDNSVLTDNNYADAFSISEGNLTDDSYRAENQLQAAYLSYEQSLFQGVVDLYGGVRYEWDERKLFEVNTPDTTDNLNGEITGKPNETRFWLPSGGITVHPSEEVQLRATAGKTLDRPSLREASPYSSFDLLLYNEVLGNPSLKETEIWNYDIRAEWYPRSGEQLSIGGFYKTLDDPIEFTLFNYNVRTDERTWLNYNKATVYGIELEVRKRLDFIPVHTFKNISFFGNATIQRSEVRDEELLVEVDNERPLQGAAPYIVNAGLTYDQPSRGTQASVLLNNTGTKLLEAAGPVSGAGAVGGTYQQSNTEIDLQVSQQLTPWLEVKATAENIFDETIRVFRDFNQSQEFDQGEYLVVPEITPGQEFTDSVVREYKRGRTFSVSLKMTL